MAYLLNFMKIYDGTSITKSHQLYFNLRNARFATFFHVCFLTPNLWNEDYWNDWIGIGAKDYFWSHPYANIQLHRSFHSLAKLLASCPVSKYLVF